ncbi:MAG: N-acetylglucosamine-6-phosphate deacetylase [Mycobacteriales bacterium]
MLLRGRRVLLDGRLVADVDVWIADGVVVATGPAGTEPAQLVDVIAPGFVDVHVHALDGCGVVLEDTDVSGLGTALAHRGVTSFLATTGAAPLDHLLAVLAAAGDVPGCLGVHLEGPWLSPARAGAQPVQHLCLPSVTDLRTLLAAGPVRVITLAPELTGAHEVIRAAREAGVVVSLGHSDASYAEALAAVELGASHITHCFNAMSGLHHREPGLVGAAFDSADLTVEVIADGVHVHPAAVRALVSAAGPERVCLVSDAVDLPVGGKDAARLADGTLAGSRSGLDAAVRNVVAWGIAVEDALVMAATTPARVAGRPDLGRIAVGAPADLVLLDDRLRVVQTLRGGVPC